MFHLYDFPPSGNCYKLRLLMSLLGIEYERISLDITQGQSRSDKFLEINPNGRVPVLEIREGKYLPESNAALWYLAVNTKFCPTDKYGQAQALQWMFFEQYSHEPFIATSRYWISILNAKEHYKDQLEEKQSMGYAALDIMERHLTEHPYFVGRNCSIADIALYAYTHLAHEGGFDLDPYSAIRAWFKRIEKIDNYVSVTE